MKRFKKRFSRSKSSSEQVPNTKAMTLDPKTFLECSTRMMRLTPTLDWRRDPSSVTNQVRDDGNGDSDSDIFASIPISLSGQTRFNNERDLEPKESHQSETPAKPQTLEKLKRGSLCSVPNLSIFKKHSTPKTKSNSTDNTNPRHQSTWSLGPVVNFIKCDWKQQ